MVNMSNQKIISVDKMKKNKTKIIIALLLIIGFVSLLVFLNIRKNKNIITKPPTKTPNIQYIPFKLVQKPTEGKLALAVDNFALAFSFSKEINKESIFIDIKPETEYNFDFSNDNKTLYIYPKDKWINNQKYKITINLKSKDNESLEKEITYEFTPYKPEDSKLDESQIGY